MTFDDSALTGRLPRGAMVTPAAPDTRAARLVIVTGGAGRRSAAHAMEDLGWYVVDNLPSEMIPHLIDVAVSNGLTRICVVLDVRSTALVEQLPQTYEELAARGITPEVLFLEAADEVIVKRQESSRRPLPLQGDGRLVEAIVKERRLLGPLRAGADMVIDTTNLTVHQLGSRIAHAYGADGDHLVRMAIMSFGFKNGLPIDADLVFDVRFLPNPHWVPELRPMTGLSEPVRDYVLSRPGAEDFLDAVMNLLRVVAPGYLREGKRQLTIAVGCTGGKHRSTATSEELARRLREAGHPVKVIHRDLGLE